MNNGRRRHPVSIQTHLNRGDFITIIHATNPNSIQKSLLLKLSRLDQLAAQALESVGKLRIVDDITPCFPHVVEDTVIRPPSGGYRNCAPSPDHGGMVAQAGVEGVPVGASLVGDARAPIKSAGRSIRTSPIGGHQPAFLGSYRIKGELRRRQAGTS
jgi:hypothetical protein